MERGLPARGRGRVCHAGHGPANGRSHPKQVALANEWSFTPSRTMADRRGARDPRRRWNKPKPEGAGATVYKGRLVDIASIKQAEVIVKQAEMIAAG